MKARTEIILVICRHTNFPVIILKLHYNSTGQIYGELYEGKGNKPSETYKTTGHGYNKKQDCLEHFFAGTHTNLSQLQNEGYTIIEINSEKKYPATVLQQITR